MSSQESKDFLDLRAALILFILTLLWGLNYPAIKYSNQGISPVFACGLRSGIATLCGVLYCIKKKETLFHTDIRLFLGFMLALLLGLEFACIYFGMLYTDAARSVFFVYLSPFVVSFMSYFLWFKLIHEYSVSRLSAFTFFTSIFGVLFGILFLNEEFTLSLMLGLPMVSLGIFFVNWRRRATASL